MVASAERSSVAGFLGNTSSGTGTGQLTNGDCRAGPGSGGAGRPACPRVQGDLGAGPRNRGHSEQGQESETGVEQTQTITA